MHCREPKIVYSVVRDGERMKVDLTDVKLAAGFYLLNAIVERPGAFAWFIIVNISSFAYIGVAGFGGNVNGTIDGLKQHTQTAGVVAMFMRDQNGVDFLHVFADECKSARNFPGAEPGVNENTSLARNDQNRIAS